MNAAERRKEIMEYLEQNQEAYTASLCQRMSVSAMTIHRDFAYLARQGLITLLRGGAALNHGAAVLHSLQLRQTCQPEEKRRIAAYCAGLVKEGESVFIDCGSTALCIAEALRAKKNVLVLTASLDAAQILSAMDGIQLIMVPGVFAKPLRGFTGQMTVDFMRRFFVDWMFLGANGLDSVQGLSSPDYTDAETKRALLRQARRLVVAADHTKLGQSCFEIIAGLSEIDRIVTDRGAERDVVKDFTDQKIEMILV